MNLTFAPEQFSQLLELILTTNFLSFFAAIVVYDFVKGLIVRLISQPSSPYPNYFKMHQFVRKAHRSTDFENYYRSVKRFIHKNCA
ncbi:hypothetical protein [Vibrio tarriae]|uniref:hypothetical protein n=1 Tax=Vibrio tarriae TaxID=2014742 RepID=UPI000DE1FCE5|nr:hypothetical protein [Vibrio tarriae]RBM38907.1 hypothetical protein DLR63_09330 [Vibrio tarriae]